FADFAAQRHFNTLVLYLEGRVRTRSFPYLPREQTYSLEEMARVVEHARGAGLECIFATATLAHCEQFFSCKELAHLAEERDGRTRFDTTRLETFCPSLPATYDFLRSYLNDLTQVFTGPHLHVGCDESFNLGFCKLCAERRTREGLSGLFTQHVLKMKEICHDLGKRMWIWDDMYELFPNELEKLSRDIVLCHWNYDPLIESEGAPACFANRWRQNWLKLYIRHGFDVVFCPWSDVMRNVETFTMYARRHTVFLSQKNNEEKIEEPSKQGKVLGGLLTQWEMQNFYNEEHAPAVAVTGEWWNQPAADSEQAWRDGLQEILPGLSTPLAHAVRILASIPRQLPPPFEKYLPGPLTESEQHRRSALQAGLELLRIARTQCQPAHGSEILDELDFSARQKLLYTELHALVPAIHDPQRIETDLPCLIARATACRKELDELIINREPIHAQRRPGMCPANGALENLRRLRTALMPVWERLKQPVSPENWWLTLRLCLTDFYGAPRLSVALTFGDKVQPLITDCLKPQDCLGPCFYTIRVPFSSAAKPDGVRLEVWGYGGQGIAFLEAQNQSETLMPQKIRQTSGLVARPEALLRDDSIYTYLGQSDYAAAMLNPALADEHAVMEVAVASV
ncbi:MAG: family 20 glycosylhydrolase, partial [Planctomycetota bacterium]